MRASDEPAGPERTVDTTGREDVCWHGQGGRRRLWESTKTGCEQKSPEAGTSGSIVRRNQLIISKENK